MIMTRTYQLDSQNLCTVTEEKDLRVLIDNDLQFENHILSKIKTANRITGLVRRNFKNIDFPGFLLMYKSMIRSHLEYAQTVWSPHKVHTQAQEAMTKSFSSCTPDWM